MSNRKRPRGRPSKYPPEFQRDAVAMVLDEHRAIVGQRVPSTRNARASCELERAPTGSGWSGFGPAPVLMAWRGRFASVVE